MLDRIRAKSPIGDTTPIALVVDRRTTTKIREELSADVERLRHDRSDNLRSEAKRLLAAGYKAELVRLRVAAADVGVRADPELKYASFLRVACRLTPTMPTSRGTRLWWMRVSSARRSRSAIASTSSLSWNVRASGSRRSNRGSSRSASSTVWRRCWTRSNHRPHSSRRRDSRRRFLVGPHQDPFVRASYSFVAERSSR